MKTKAKHIKYLFLYFFCMVVGQVYAQSDAERAVEGMFTEVFYYDTTKGTWLDSAGLQRLNAFIDKVKAVVLPIEDEATYLKITFSESQSSRVQIRNQYRDTILRHIGAELKKCKCPYYPVPHCNGFPNFSSSSLPNNSIIFKDIPSDKVKTGVAVVRFFYGEVLVKYMEREWINDRWKVKPLPYKTKPKSQLIIKERILFDTATFTISKTELDKLDALLEKVQRHKIEYIPNKQCSSLIVKYCSFNTYNEDWKKRNLMSLQMDSLIYHHIFTIAEGGRDGLRAYTLGTDIAIEPSFVKLFNYSYYPEMHNNIGIIELCFIKNSLDNDWWYDNALEKHNLEWYQFETTEAGRFKYKYKNGRVVKIIKKKDKQMN